MKLLAWSPLIAAIIGIGSLFDGESCAPRASEASGAVTEGGGPANTAVPGLQNPSFDDPVTGRDIPGWSQQGERYGSAVITRDRVTSPPQALRMTVLGSGSSGEKSFMVFQVLDLEAYRGKRVQFGARVWQEGAGVNVVLWTPQRSESSFDKNVNGTRFVERRGVLDVPTNATVMTFGIQILGPARGTAWVDDVFVRIEGDGAQPAPATAPASTQGEARVDIDARSAQRRLSPLIFGMHIEWIENGQGLLDSRRDELRSEVVSLLRPLHIPLFRFPGGIHADYYDYRLGIGPAQSRGSSDDVFSGKKTKHRFGTPELVQLLKVTGAEALITANYGTGSAGQAAGWARAFGQLGVRPEYWEIGNEIYLASPRSNDPNGRAIYHPPEQYARDFPAYADSIRAIIPNAHVGAIGYAETGTFNLAPEDNRDWTERMLRSLKARADFLALHVAYAPVILDDRWNFEDERQRGEVYKAMFAAAGQIQDNLNLASRTVATLSPINRGIPLAVTEFGPFFGVSRKGDRHAQYVDQTRTLASAIYTASVLDVFIGDPHVVMAAYTNPIHQWYGSLITDTKASLVRTPTYYVYLLYRTRFESQLLSAVVTSPTFDSREVGIVKARSRVPELLARASVSEDRRRLTVMLVNRSLDHTLATTLNVTGFTPARTDCQVLTAASPAAISGPAVSKSTRQAEEVVPTSVACTAGSAIQLRIPPSAIVSVVAER